MSIIVDEKHTLGDLSRLWRSLWTYLVFLALGFLFAMSLNEKRIQDNDINNTCPIPVVSVTCPQSLEAYLIKVPVGIPQTGVEGASNR